MSDCVASVLCARGGAAGLYVLGDDSLPSELCIYVVKFPIIEVISDRDCVEREEPLRAARWGISSVASFLMLKGVGDLSPLETPHALSAQSS